MSKLEDYVKILIPILIIALLICAPLFYEYTLIGSTVCNHTVHVTDKYIKSNSNNNQIYLIVDNDTNIYKDVDDLWYWKFNSSDVYVQMKPGHDYNVTSIGWRFEWFSDYPNILSAKEI